MRRQPEAFDDVDDRGRGKRLFHIEPEGGFSHPESLHSWVVNLARAHSLSPRVLLKYLIAQSEQHSDVWNGTTFFERDSVTMNGFGKYARMTVDLLQPDTAVDVESMTLLSLTGLFPHNGEGALARHPKWCAHCLCEQARANQRLHLKLAWSFEHYRVCPVHKVHLSGLCPACASPQSFVPIHPSLVHCGACGRPLLAELEEDEECGAANVTKFEAWCSTAIDDMIARRATLKAGGSLATFRTNIAAIVHKLSPGNRKLLCESIGLQAYALNGWLNKDERPSLAVVLKFGFGVSVQVADFFLPDAASLAAGPNSVDAECSKRGARPMLGLQRRKDTESLLAVIIDDLADCRPLAKVAEQLGLSRSALKYWFRSACCEIVLKNRRFESRRQEVRYQTDHDILRAVVQSLRAKDLNPSRRRVDAGLRRHGLALARPDIFLAYEKLR